MGGVSGSVTVERGTEDRARSAVRRALETLEPNGHVLSPIDYITVDAPPTWRTIDILFSEWRHHW